MTDTTEHREPAGTDETPRRRGPLAFWTSALFVVLALSGFSILFGREVILPIVGPDALGLLLQVSQSESNKAGDRT